MKDYSIFFVSFICTYKWIKWIQTSIPLTISRPQKVVLFRKSARWKKFYDSPARIVKCVSEYIFLISKNIKQKKASKNRKRQNKLKKKREYLPKNDLKNKFATARVKIFLVNHSFGKRSFFSLENYFLMISRE